MCRSSFRAVLAYASVLYLLLPCVIFAVGWLRQPLAWALSGGVVWLYVWLCQRRIFGEIVLSRPLLGALGAIGVVAVAWAIGCGIGGWVPQKSDYDKHNLLFYDLITRPWPVVYTNPTYQDPLLCYYVGYYLPTAALAKYLHVPLRWVDALSLGWGALGLELSLGWVWSLVGRRGWVVASGFMMFSGLEVPLRMLHALLTQPLPSGATGTWPGLMAHLHHHIPTYFVFSDGELARSQVFTPLVAHLQWAPQHALGAWVATGLFWSYGRRVSLSIWALMGVVLLLWSPFVAVGWGVLLLFCYGKHLTEALRSAMSLRHAGVWGLVVAWAGVLVAYLMSHWPLAYAGLITEAFLTTQDLLLYGVFWLFQLWLPVWLLHRSASTAPDRGLSTVAVVIQVLSLIYVGKFNDWLMRSILPAQMIFFVILAKQILVSRRNWAWYLLCGWVLLGATYAMRSVRQTFKAVQHPPAIVRNVPNAPHNFGEADLSRMARDERYPNTDFAAQYLGRQDSWFYRYVARSAPQR